MHCRARTVMWHGNFNDRSNSSGLPSASVSAAIVHETFFLPADFELFDALDTLAAVGDICRSSGRSRRAVVSGLKQPLRGAHFLPPHYGLPMFTKQCASYNPSAYTRSLHNQHATNNLYVCVRPCVHGNSGTRDKDGRGQQQLDTVVYRSQVDRSCFDFRFDFGDCGGARWTRLGLAFDYGWGD